MDKEGQEECQWSQLTRKLTVFQVAFEIFDGPIELE